MKRFVKSHKHLLGLARKLLRKKKRSIREFTSFKQAEKDISEWIKTFPERYDLVLGIPRSGLYVASLVALKLGLPISTPSAFLRGEVWFSKGAATSVLRTVLLVDDGVGDGFDGQMVQNFNVLTQAFPNLRFVRAALYIYSNCANAVDLYYRFYDVQYLNREEWNLLHRKFGVVGFDMDGTLCHDWDEKRYSSYNEFIVCAEPYLIPNFKIDYIITSREERYRDETLAWLNKYGVKFGQLIMRKNRDKSAVFKATQIKALKLDWYFENNLAEAKFIHKKTGVPVLNVSSMSLIGSKHKFALWRNS